MAEFIEVTLAERGVPGRVPLRVLINVDHIKSVKESSDSRVERSPSIDIAGIPMSVIVMSEGEKHSYPVEDEYEAIKEQLIRLGRGNRGTRE